jgi:predicted phosphohydrolase
MRARTRALGCRAASGSKRWSAPHIHRHQKLRIKITDQRVEIFWRLERVVLHTRCRHRSGKRIVVDAHFPPASQAYYEATPQKLLSQSRFVHPDLNAKILAHLEKAAPDQYQSELPLGARAPPSQASLL